jgi:hypothetical protein
MPAIGAVDHDRSKSADILMEERYFQQTILVQVLNHAGIVKRDGRATECASFAASRSLPYGSRLHRQCSWTDGIWSHWGDSTFGIR